MSGRPLAPGLRAPDFALPCPSGDPVRFYGRAGGIPCALIFANRSQEAPVEEFAAALARAREGRVEILGVISGGDLDSGEPPLSFDTFTEPGTAVSEPYGAASEKPMVCLLDENLRILGWWGLADPAGAAAEVAGRIAAACGQPEGKLVESPAPVLLVPRVLDEAWCAALISKWREGAAATGVEASLGGRRVDVVAGDRKRRRDHVVSDPGLLQRLTSHVGRRVIPELQKAFAYRASRFEGFKIVCYGAEEGGFFHAHRDNLSPATAHRRFGLTVNLNGGFEGGELRFPEYGQDLYRPPAGAAIIFSSSLLHEVLPVTSGERFSLVSFLFASPRQERAAHSARGAAM